MNSRSANTTMKRKMMGNLKRASSLNVVNTTSVDNNPSYDYDKYLQALLKQVLIDKEIEQYTRVVENQISHQKEIIKEKENHLKEIQQGLLLQEQKEKLVIMINNLEKNMTTFINLTNEHEIQKHLEAIQGALEEASGTLTLINLKLTEGDQEQLAESVKKLLLASDIIMKSGRDFEGVHKLAEKSQNLLAIMQEVVEITNELTTMGTLGTQNVLQKLSDEFAKDY
ncbi:unnamed protein product [Phyllotreta striolata]|uniref:Uncharacterized protein n=1 Tax=Phyllotreta striolata TaxID=444603 RepID=A0A9N9TJF1_PHYSR|nr:unnamed protein product [Phyllotreta striolata]